jgi:hypothetical protein
MFAPHELGGRKDKNMPRKSKEKSEADGMSD